MGVKVEVSYQKAPRVEIDEQAISRWIESRLNDARNIFIRNVSRGGGSGRVYRRGKKTHRASAPGEYPVTDSGRLVNSVDSRMITPTEGHMFSEIDYAEFLVTGTRPPHNMAKRKMLAEALEEALARRPPIAGLVRITE